MTDGHGARPAAPGAAVDDEARLAVEAWAKRWFLDPAGNDRLSIGGLPVGWALHIEVASAVLAAALPALGRPERLVGRPAFRHLRRHGIDRAVRALVLRAMQPRGWRVRPAGVALVSELATPSALDASLAIAEALGPSRVAVAAGDPRALLRWRTAGHRPAALVLGPGPAATLLRRASRALDVRWPAARTAAPPLVVAGRDLTAIALAAADPIVRRSGPWLSVEAAAIRGFLERTAPHTIAVASDQHRLGRLAVHLAGGGGTRSVVLQHGLPQATLGYVPVVADHVAAWSEDAVRWFVDMGTPEDRLHLLGNPRLDRTVALAERAGGGPKVDGPAGGPRIMAAVSVASAEVNEQLVRVAVDALRALPAATLVVKLHPGGSDWRPVRRVVAQAGQARDRVQVREREPLEPLLAHADVVVVHRSTVAGEALAAGRPVIAVTAASPSIAERELVDLQLPSVANGQELARLVERLHDPANRAAFLAERKPALERAMGPLDGRSTARVAEFLASGGAMGSDRGGDDQRPA